MTNVRRVALLIAVCLFSDSMLYIVLPLYWEAYGLDAIWQVGILLAANRIVRIPLHPWIARFYRHNSIRSGILIAVSFTILTSLAFALLSGFWLLLLARVIWGVAWGLLGQAGQLTVVEESRRHGGQAGLFTGMFHSYMRTGTLIGMACGGLLMEWLGRSWIGLLFACAAILIVPIVLRMSNEKFARQQIKIKTPRIGAFVPIFITGFIVTFVINGIFTSTISYWVAQQDLSDIMWLGGLSAAAWVAIFMSLRWLWDPFLAPWVGKHTDRTGQRLPWLVATALVSSACFFMLPLDLPTYLWLGNLFMLLIGITILFTLQEAWFVEKVAQSAEHRHHIISSYSIWSDVGSALGPIVAYLLLTYAGEQQVLLSAILLLVVAAFIWLANEQKRCQTR